ncbi:phage integrase SAM-like domain-containing protein [Pedobacter sp. Hv1]|uniref:tyrosine-type recombinase/integrase n=1 Tax=Pedobacter sp. Hv1 TaxID=1740090 RepID=UPI0009E8732B|nr:phage integrase SAM-like domain-containing protein [Pedobacter sp. Hv1]
MQPPSKPQLNTDNPTKWYIWWNHDVPFPLWNNHPRKRIRIKKYDNINRFKGDERLKYAKLRLKVWEYVLKHSFYNPFEAELNELNSIKAEIKAVELKIEKAVVEADEKLKGNTNIIKALDLYMDSRIERINNTNSLSTHRGVIKWFTKFLTEKQLLHLKVSEIKRQHIADALLFTKKDREWGPTTYNSHVELIMTVFNWFEKEEYIVKNPASGKIDKVRAIVGIHKWYPKEIATPLKKYMLDTGENLLYNACAFTYHLCVRSQQELLKMKVADIDFNLKRVRFRKEITKNGREAFRDFTPDFEKIVESMNIKQLPGEWYIFGSGGKPSIKMAGKNSLARIYKEIKDTNNLPEEYTIYSWKHTRVIHEMMKKTSPYEIQHICRHSSLTETEKYMRGFDISLNKVYNPEDLKFN